MIELGKSALKLTTMELGRRHRELGRSAEYLSTDI